MATWEVISLEVWGNEWPRCSVCGSTVVPGSEGDSWQHGGEAYTGDPDDGPDHEPDDEGERDGFEVNNLFRTDTFVEIPDDAGQADILRIMYDAGHLTEAALNPDECSVDGDGDMLFIDSASEGPLFHLWRV